jgi:predicted transcriptional regulator
VASVTEMTHITARVPVALADELAVLAEKADRTVSAELRRAIKAYIEKETKQNGAA